MKGNSDPYRDDIIAVSLSDGDTTWTGIDPSCFGSIRSILADPGIVKVIHNASFDLKFLIHKLGLVPGEDYDPSSIYDSLLVERLLHAGHPKYVHHGLDDVLARRMGVMLDKSIRESFGQYSGELSDAQYRYMEQDVIHLPKLYEMQMNDINAQRIGRVVGLENKLTSVVAKMELRGINFDPDLWKMYQERIATEMMNVKRKLAEMLGLSVQLSLDGEIADISINLNSTKQVGALYAQLGIKVDSTGDETMEAWLQENPNHRHVEVVKLMRSWRKWSKAASWSAPEKVNPFTQRIHCSWNQIEAGTGRFSSSGPNMQNVERPTENRPNFRHLFPAAVGYLYIIADYNQQEPRALAQICGDPNLRRACQEQDVYSSMAQEVYGHPVTKKDPIRQTFKTCVLAMFYGAAPATVARDQHQPEEDMEKLQREVFKAFPMAREYRKRIEVIVKQNGFTRTPLGRTRYYPQLAVIERLKHRPDAHIEIAKAMNMDAPIWSTSYAKALQRIVNEAVNAPIQGTGADMMKLSLVAVDDIIRKNNYDAGIVLTVHDEMVVECREDQAQELYPQVIQAMQDSGQLLCPDVKMIADGTIDRLWQKT
jgi:DNA polymerase-1